MFVNLIAFRNSLGLKQNEFADSIGYKRSTYSAYEKGEREPKSDFWVAISKKYGVSIDYLMGIVETPFPAKFDEFDEDTKQRVLDFCNLSPEARNRILEILDLIQK